MKKFIYSVYTKAIAAVLCVIFTVTAALVTLNGASKYSEDCGIGEPVYRFEYIFSDSVYLGKLLCQPETAVYCGFRNAYYEETYTAEEIADCVEEQLSNYVDDDKINYYIEIKDAVLTNCDAKSGDDLRSSGFFRYSQHTTDGNVGREFKNGETYISHDLDGIDDYLDNLGYESDISVYASINDEYADMCEAIWLNQKYVTTKTLTAAFALLICALALFIYLLCVCGTDKNGDKKTVWVDNIWTEIHLALLCLCSVFGFAIDAYWAEVHIRGRLPLNFTSMAVAGVTLIACTIILTSALSITRNIKCKNFINSSFILRTFKWFSKNICRLFYSKMGILHIILLFGYTAIIELCGIFVPETAFALIFAVLLFIIAAFLIGFRAIDLSEIKNGVGKVKNGFLSYKIPELKCDDLKMLAENINGIASGLDASVAAKVKAEKMKTELITNVSHDLKTPITSIITYTELLEKTENLPEEARDYIAVISKKSNRLKNLTQDLFDISKAQSGNENITLEKLDTALLINQSLGEHDSEIKKSNIQFCINAPKEMYITADGRKMSRVIGNLIGNILKYSMEKTRAFITVNEKDGDIVMEFKNISSYPMEFTADEITGRFVRGDEARSTEGNGLGLAIAKSYTELCGGRFDVIIDGDLFKAIITFKHVK